MKRVRRPGDLYTEEQEECRQNENGRDDVFMMSINQISLSFYDLI